MQGGGREGDRGPPGETERGVDDTMEMPCMIHGAGRILSACGFRYMAVSWASGTIRAHSAPPFPVVTGFRSATSTDPGVMLIMVREDGIGPERPGDLILAAGTGWCHNVSTVLLVYERKTLIIDTAEYTGTAGRLPVVRAVPRGWTDLREDGCSPADPENPFISYVECGSPSAWHERSDQLAGWPSAKAFSERLSTAEKRFSRFLLAENPLENEERLAVASRTMVLALVMRMVAGACDGDPDFFPGPAAIARGLIGDGDPWNWDIQGVTFPIAVFEDEARALCPGVSPFVLFPFPFRMISRALALLKSPVRHNLHGDRQGAPGDDTFPELSDTPLAAEYMDEIIRVLSECPGGRFLEVSTGPLSLAPLIAGLMEEASRRVPCEGGVSIDGPTRNPSLRSGISGTAAGYADQARLFLVSADPCTVLSGRFLLGVLGRLTGNGLSGGSGSWFCDTVRLVSPFITHPWWSGQRVSFSTDSHEGHAPAISEVFDGTGDIRAFDCVLVTAEGERQHLKARERAFLEETSGVYHRHSGEFPYLAEAALDLLAPGGVMFTLSPSGWLNLAYGRRFRNVLAGNRVERVAVFQVASPSGRPAVRYAGIVLKRADPGSTTRFTSFVYRQGLWLPDTDTWSRHPAPSDQGWRFEDHGVSRVRKRMEEVGTPLWKYCMGSLSFSWGSRKDTGIVPGTAHGPGSGVPVPEEPGNDPPYLPVSGGVCGPGHPKQGGYFVAEIRDPCSSRPCTPLVTVMIPGKDRFLMRFLESVPASFYLSTDPLLTRDLETAVAGLPIVIPDLFDQEERALYEVVRSAGTGRRGLDGSGTPDGSPDGKRPDLDHSLPDGPDRVFFRLYGLSPGEQAVARENAVVTVVTRVSGLPGKRKRRRRKRNPPGK